MDADGIKVVEWPQHIHLPQPLVIHREGWLHSWVKHWRTGWHPASLASQHKAGGMRCEKELEDQDILERICWYVDMLIYIYVACDCTSAKCFVIHPIILLISSLGPALVAACKNRLCVFHIFTKPPHPEFELWQHILQHHTKPQIPKTRAMINVGRGSINAFQ